jgi:hypothetical protein
MATSPEKYDSKASLGIYLIYVVQVSVQLTATAWPESRKSFGLPLEAMPSTQIRVAVD